MRHNPSKVRFCHRPLRLGFVKALLNVDFADELSVHAPFCPTPKRETQMNDLFGFIIHIPDVLRKERPVCKGEEDIFLCAGMVLIRRIQRKVWCPKPSDSRSI